MLSGPGAVSLRNFVIEVAISFALIDVSREGSRFIVLFKMFLFPTIGVLSFRLKNWQKLLAIRS